jgi:hypothetical protein
VVDEADELVRIVLVLESVAGKGVGGNGEGEMRRV